MGLEKKGGEGPPPSHSTGGIKHAKQVTGEEVTG